MNWLNTENVTNFIGTASAYSRWMPVQGMDEMRDDETGCDVTRLIHGILHSSRVDMYVWPGGLDGCLLLIPVYTLP